MGKSPNTKANKHRARILAAQAKSLGITVATSEIMQDMRSWEAIIHAHTIKAQNHTTGENNAN